MKISANQAAHTMSANARLFQNVRMENIITTNGTSTAADIVWL
ncbi:hypothetical protein [Pelagicoccus mobilis]|nr:hypothetical protein [Pelagicoccus mobilis]